MIVAEKKKTHMYVLCNMMQAKKYAVHTKVGRLRKSDDSFQNVCEAQHFFRIQLA